LCLRLLLKLTFFYNKTKDKLRPPQSENTEGKQNKRRFTSP